jgi:hypothetical protein
MAAAVNMRNALQRCGFNLATSDFIMGQQGYDYPEELLSVSEDDLDLMTKSASRHAPPDVQFPSLPIRKLYILRFLAAERVRVGLPTSPILFTEQVINNFAGLMRSG